jgi:hypothetical protein
MRSLCLEIGSGLYQGFYKRCDVFARVKDDHLFIVPMLILGYVWYGIMGKMLGEGKVLGSLLAIAT